MWQAETPRKIFAYTAPTDMRKSFHGLLALVQQVFRDEDPYSGSLFVFVNRRGDQVSFRIPIEDHHDSLSMASASR